MYTEDMTSSAVLMLQELITNTSLAELEKQLKESPFKSPQIGE